MPSSRQISGTYSLASTSLSASITWLSVNFDFFMQNLPLEKIPLLPPPLTRGGITVSQLPA
jgi:hypothetical protein